MLLHTELLPDDQASDWTDHWLSQAPKHRPKELYLINSATAGPSISVLRSYSYNFDTSRIQAHVLSPG